MYLSSYLSIFLSIHPSICLYVWQAVSPSVCLSNHPSIHLVICLSICLSVLPSVSPSIHLFICLSFRPPARPSIRQSDMCLIIHPSSYISIHSNHLFYAPASKDRGHIVLPLSDCPSVRPSVCLHKLNMKT